MKVKQLREVFHVAARQYRKDRKEDIADALSAFAANLLREDDAGTVAALVTRVERAREGRAAQKGASAAKSSGHPGRKNRPSSKARR